MAQKDDLEYEAGRAGLRSVWEKFPQDVASALEQARLLSSRLPRSLEPADEPTPPMRVGPRS